MAGPRIFATFLGIADPLDGRSEPVARLKHPRLGLTPEIALGVKDSLYLSGHGFNEHVVHYVVCESVYEACT